MKREMCEKQAGSMSEQRRKRVLLGFGFACIKTEWKDRGWDGECTRRERSERCQVVRVES